MGSTRSDVLKILIASAALVIAILLVLDLASIVVGSGGCDSSFPTPLAGAKELHSAFRELISLGWLAAGDRTVCIGPNAIATAVIARRVGLLSAIAAPASACCALPFDGESFDFAFSATLDRARVPARVLLEMERVLRPGRVGAIFHLRTGSRSGSARPEDLMKAAAPVASLLRFSDVIGAQVMNGSAMIVFRKQRLSGSGIVSAGQWSGGGRKCMDRMTKMPRIIRDIIELLGDAIVQGTGRFGIDINLLAF